MQEKYTEPHRGFAFPAADTETTTQTTLILISYRHERYVNSVFIVYCPSANSNYTKSQVIDSNEFMKSRLASGVA